MIRANSNTTSQGGTASSQPNTEVYQYRGQRYNTMEEAEAARNEYRNSSQTQQASSVQAAPHQKYNYRGKEYNTLQEAQSAKQRYLSAVEADWETAGYDAEKYNAILSSGSGYSQMSDNEIQYLQKKYAESDVSKRKAYTESNVDKYLSSMGLPSSKELATYRQKYIDYLGNGGMEQYSQLLEKQGDNYYFTDAAEWIKKQWEKDNAVGLNDETVTQGGKNIKYEDTLLDEQLKEQGFPPSAQLNEYFLKYKADRQAKEDTVNYQKRVDNMFSEVMRLENNGMDREEAFNKVSENYKDFIDSSKQYKDVPDYGISLENYEKFYARKSNEKKWAKYAEQQNKIYEDGQRAFVTPAVTEDEKKAQAEALSKYFSVYKPVHEDGTPVSLSEYSGYLELMNSGIPTDVIESASTQGISAYEDWNDKVNGGDLMKWSETKAMLDGLSKDDGDYAANIRLLGETHTATQLPNYSKDSKYDPSLYGNQIDFEKSTSRSTAVSFDGAMYNIVNGREYGQIVGMDDAQRDMFDEYTSTRNVDKALVDYMSADEKGTFNLLFKESTKRGMDYLSRLQPLLETRRDNEMSGNVLFATSRESAENAAYKLNIASKGQQLSDIKEGMSTYWQKEAWERYSSYSDEALQRIVAENSDENIQNVSRDDIHRAEDMMNVRNDVQFVLDTRKQAREDAQVVASLYDYREEDGKKATEYVQSHMDEYANSEYVKLANGAEGILEENQQEAEEAKKKKTFSAGSMQMQIDLGGLKTYKEDELAPTFAKMTDDERNKYNWLLVNQGEKAANAYVNTIYHSMASKAAIEKRAEYASIADDGHLSNVRASLASVLNYPFGGMTAIASNLLNKAVGIETNAEQATRWDVTGGIREGVQQNIGELFENDTIENVANFLYGVTMSSLDSGLGAVMFGGSDMGALMLSTSAYASTLRTSLDKGLSNEDASRMAVASAIIEYVTEKLGIDHLVEGMNVISNAPVNSTREYAMNVLKQMGINFIPEALEEGVGNIAETVFDMIANGDSAELTEYYDSLIAKGMTQEEARKLAGNKFARETALEMLAGGLAGAQSVGAGGFGNYVGMRARHGVSAWANPEGTRAWNGHSLSYSKGKAVVENIFNINGLNVSDAVQSYIDTEETVLDKRNIDNIANLLTELRSTDDLYDYVYDENGKMKLSNDERIALAAALNFVSDGAGLESLDAVEQAYVDFMANNQAARERLSNTNINNIKTSQELHDARAKMETLRSDIENAKQDYQGELDKAQTALRDSEARLQAVQEKKNAVQNALLSRVGGDATKLSTQLNNLLNSESALITEVNNHQNALNKITGERKRDLNTLVKNANAQIKDIQKSLDRHYASYSNLLATATTKRSVYEAQYRNAIATTVELGKQIDSLIDSNGNGYVLDSGVEQLQMQLAEAEAEARMWQSKMNKTSKGTLSEAIAAAHSGTVKDYVASLEPAKTAVPTASNSASSTETVNAPTNMADSIRRASDTVKQENTAESSEQTESEQAEEEKPKSEQKTENKTEKKTYTISKTTQEKFNRIAKKFGLEIVWQTSEEIGGNGKYNPEEPNKIYLATDMLANKGLLKEQVVAREFFTHEVVHYVANTKWYQRLSMLAEAWYKYKGDEEFGGGQGNSYYNFLIERQQQQEKELHNRDFSREQAREELTAYFVQDILFGDKNSLNWLTRMDGNAVQNFLATVEYLIKRGQVRRMKDGSAIKTLLLDSERALAEAIRERKILDAAGMSSAFSTGKNKTETSQPQTAAPSAEANAEQSNSEMHSAGTTIEELSRGFAENERLDAEYLALANAYKDGEITAEEKMRLKSMVAQAARNAGYNSPMLFSGTDAFGFTQIDSAEADDGFSFWASDKEETAKTYTANQNLRRISDEEISDDVLEANIDEAEAKLDDAISKYLQIFDNTFSEWYFGQGGGQYVREQVLDANPESGYGDGVYDVLMDWVYDAFNQYSDDEYFLSTFFSADEIEAGNIDVSRFEESDIFDEISEAIVNVESARRLYDDAKESYDNNIGFGGVYSLYGNTNNFFELTGNDGNNWNWLFVKEMDGGEESQSTRRVTQWAREQGYDGVIFRNIRDNGRYSTSNPSSDVYAFFRPQQQVKSADLVTYDNDGDIISLSARFNRYADDLRYSAGTTISDLSSDFNPNISGRAATMSGEDVAVTDVSEAIDRSAVLTNENGEPVMNVINNGNGAMFSLGTYDAGGRDALDAYLEKRVNKQLLDRDQADSIKNQMERIYKFSKEFANKNVAFGNWSYAEVRKDPNGNPSLSVITPNAEYDMNMDFSLVCVKRRALNEVINEIVRRGLMESLIFDEEAIARVNEKIRSMNYETACKMCFVESARYEQAKYADKFVERYNKLVNSLGGEADYFNFGGNETLAARTGIQYMSDGNLDFTEIDKVLDEYMKRKGIDTLPAYNADKGLAGANTDEAIAFELKNNPESRRLLLRGDFMSTNGFDSLAMRSPSVLKLWNKKGQGAPKNQFSDMQYLNDIENKNWNPEAAYAVGGVRVQSFSDYVPTMFFDYVQMFADLAAGKMPAHAYTKEQNFVKLFGLTGIKINMSLVPMVADDGLAAGLKYQRDENGNIVKDANGQPVITYAWAEESFGYDRKKKELNYDLINSIQADEKYGKNCGTIAIGVSDEHILRMMADPAIKMIIPYHSSNIPSVVADMVNIKAFEDYQDIQHTRKWNGKKWVNLSPKEEFRFNERLRELGDPKAVVKEYLDWCEKNGYAPKFEADNKSTKFKNNDGYYKVLEDFTLYDNSGNYVPQGAVQMKFAEDGDLFGNVESILEKSLKDPRMSMISENVSKLTDEVLSVLQTNPNQTMYGSGSTISDLSQGYTPRETFDDLREIFNQRDKRPSSPADDRYMELARKYDESNGRSEQRWLESMVKKAANSAGYTTPILYHGTPSFGFTEFSTDGSLPYARKGYIYASTKREVSANYGGRNNYAGVREIGRKYDGGSSADSIIQDAKTVWGATYAIPTEEDVSNRIRKDYSEAEKIQEKLNELYVPFSDYPRDVSNAIDWITFIPNVIVDNDLSFDGGVDGILNATQEERSRLKADIEDAFRRAEEYKYKEIIRDYFSEHHNEMSDKEREFFRYLMSYDFGDALIDFEYGIASVLDPSRLLINKTNESFQDMDSMRDALDDSHNIGSYQLYGNLGDKPFIFDANGSQFWALKVPEVSDEYTDTDSVVKWAKENGYTSVVMKNIYDYGDKADNYVFFNSSQVKSADPVTYDDKGEIIPLLERFNERDSDIRYSTGTTMDDLISEFGVKRQSELGKLNDVKTANQTTKTTRVSDVAQTLKEVEGISQAAKDSIDDIVIETLDENAVPVVNVGKQAGLVYRPMTMEEMNELADEYITRSGSLDQAMRDLSRDIKNATLSDLTKLEAAAMRVFREISQGSEFDREAYAEFVAAIGELNSTWGRMGKAMQLLKDSPRGRRKYMERVVERINEENRKKFSSLPERLLHRNGIKDIVIGDNLYDDLEFARTPEEVRKAEFRISEEIGKQSPLAIADAIRNWRYFAMLANPVTHGRNMLGNMGMLGMRSAKDVVASGLEALAVKTGLMDESDRTHYLNRNIPKDVRDYAVGLYLENQENVQGQDRYGVRDKMHDAIKKSPIKMFDSLMRFNGNMLEREDAVFLRMTYVSAAKQYMMSRGLTDVNALTAKQKAEIHQYAKQQAQEATYRDASALADTLNSLAKKGGAWRFAIEATIPFKKTPVNIAKRGMEYSPLGLMKGIVDLGKYAYKKGKNASGQYTIPASKIADELGKGIVGSALALIGAFLAKAGILKISAGKDDRDAAFEKDLGHQDYSLEIGDLSIKIESLVPMTFPLFAGAAVMEAVSGESKKGIIPALSEAMMSIVDPIMDMSFMSSLNSTLNSYSKNKLLGVAENALQSYASQFAPTVIGKINSSLTPTRRTTKSAQSSKETIGTQWDYAMRSFVSKIPFGSLALQPYVKTTGEMDVKSSFGDYALAHINNFASPVNIQVIDTDSTKLEMARLVESTGMTDFIPKNPQKYFTSGGVPYNLTAKEYTDYSKDHNETVYALLFDTINSEEYQNANDDDRADMLKKAYDSAHKVAMKKWKAIIISNRTASDTQAEVELETGEE